MMISMPEFHDTSIVSVDDLSRIEKAPLDQLARRLMIPLGVRHDRQADLMRSLSTAISAMSFSSPFDAIAALKERYVQPDFQNPKN